MLNARLNIILYTLSLLLSCGEHIDKKENLIPGYKFKSGKTLYQKVNKFRGQDSIAFTIDSFTIVDSFHSINLLKIKKKLASLPVPIFVPSAGAGIVSIGGGFNYGLAQEDQTIIVFPRFTELKRVTANTFLAAILKKQGNNSIELRYGLIHYKGEVLLPFKYTSITKDSTNNKLVCKRGWPIDSLPQDYLYY